MGFKQAAAAAFDEIELRRKARDGLLSFGVKYLDEAMLGIMKNDLILVGARSGAGKTQLCCNIALANCRAGKRVHFIALEAEKYEIERRIKYQLFAKKFFSAKKAYFSEPLRAPELEEVFKTRISFQKWMMGDYLPLLEQFEASAASEFIELTTDLFTFYKTSKFDVTELTARILECADNTDLVIVDHVHYFDYDDEYENSAIKTIAKAARSLSLEIGVPIVLISHLRKGDRKSDEVAPGLEEFHGSSDLFKIATKAITIAPGAFNHASSMSTYIRIVKNRFEGSVTRYIAEVEYLFMEGAYGEKYKLGDAQQKRDREFESIAENSLPEWAHSAQREIGSTTPNDQAPSTLFPVTRRKNHI